jgi:hypothetical protein
LVLGSRKPKYPIWLNPLSIALQSLLVNPKSGLPSTSASHKGSVFLLPKNALYKWVVIIIIIIIHYHCTLAPIIFSTTLFSWCIWNGFWRLLSYVW